MPYNKEKARPSRVTAALRAKGYTLKDAAAEMEVGYQHLVNVARGRTHASPQVVDGFRRIVGRPLAVFADPYVLTRGYSEINRTKR